MGLGSGPSLFETIIWIAGNARVSDYGRLFTIVNMAIYMSVFFFRSGLLESMV